MALTSVFVGLCPEYNVSISTVANCISQLTGRNVSRVDYICGEKERSCIVHFDHFMPEALWDMLNAGEEIIKTDQGPIRVGINDSNGLDPNTKDDITQFILNDDGLYSRVFKTGLVRKWNADLVAWFDTTENPFNSDIAV